MITLPAIRRRTFVPILCFVAVLSAAAAKTYNVSSPSDYNNAMKSAKKGDTVLLKANITMPCDTPVTAGVTLDLGGKTITLPDKLPDGRGSRGISVEGGGITIRNGRIDNGKWAIYAFFPASDYLFEDLRITRTKTFLKMGAAGKGVTKNITVNRVIVECDDNPWTILDIGPGSSSNVTIKNFYSKARVKNDDTGSDGIGIELALDPVTLDNVHIDGCSGDAIDIKGSAHISNSIVTNAVRQAFKIWGLKEFPSSMTNCIAVNNGFHSMANAGDVTLTDCYFEAGTKECPAIDFGAGKKCGDIDIHGVPDIYGCGGVTVTATRCRFIRRGGSAYLVSAENWPVAAKVKYIDCSFWNPTHPNLHVGAVTALKAAAQQGIWPSEFVNCKYEDVPAPDIRIRPPAASVSFTPEKTAPGEAVTFNITLIAGDFTDRETTWEPLLPFEVDISKDSAKLDGKPVELSIKDRRLKLTVGGVEPRSTHTLVVNATRR